MKSIFKNILVLATVLLLAACSSGSGDEYVDRMEDEHAGDQPVSNTEAFPQEHPVDTMSVPYALINGEEVTGYMARPEVSRNYPQGVIVIHEWWGLNENVKMMTRRLAGQGYTALAVDLYHGKVATSPDSAGAYAREARSNESRSIRHLEQAYQYLTQRFDVKNVGIIGWCFGGGYSLQASLAMPEQIDATVIYYGSLVTDPSELETLQMPILGIFGAEDSGIPPSEVNEFRDVLDSLGKEHSIHIYDGAGHAFANPSGTRFNEEAATDAWQKTVSFFEEHLKTGRE
ncbi:MAG: dienelactone hydrolase family protein [Balneolaceae bacterium]|nr:dienelactone hydrolase family protein [Balneolaceae bacterium]